MEFYKSIFGGELEFSNYEDTPADSHSTDISGMSGKVIHAALTGGEINLMASDAPDADSIAGGKVHLSLNGNDDARLRQIWERLSEGADIKSELKTEFWGDTFGMLTDKHGVSWMVNIAK